MQVGKSYFHTLRKRRINILYVIKLFSKGFTYYLFWFYLFFFHLYFNLFNKIDIVLCNVYEYGDMDWDCENEFKDCEYIVIFICYNLRF